MYEAPYEDWNDNYEDGMFDLIIFDEFKGQKAIYDMNLLTDGYVTPLKRRGKNPYLKKDKLPVIVCSNFSAGEAYKKADEMSRRAFVSRYTEVYMDDSFSIIITNLPVPEVVEEPAQKKQKIDSIILDSDSE